jgi:hypothetical protein
MCKATSVGRSCDKSRSEGESWGGGGGMTNTNNIELEERNDFFLYAEET